MLFSYKLKLLHEYPEGLNTKSEHKYVSVSLNISTLVYG